MSISVEKFEFFVGNSNYSAMKQCFENEKNQATKKVIKNCLLELAKEKRSIAEKSKESAKERGNWQNFKASRENEIYWENEISQLTTK